MKKRLNYYNIFMTAMFVVIAGLLFASGIVAIQKSMKLNLAVKMNPSITCKINASFDGGESYKEVFSNVEGDTAIGANWLISGNTLTYDNTAEGSMGMTVKLKVQNLTPNTKVMIVSLDQVKDVVATNATSSAFDVAIPAGGKVAIDFSQVFAISKGSITNATITPKSNVYTIDNTYYVKQNEEASFTLTGSGNYATPAQGAIGLPSDLIKSYSNGTLTLNTLTSDTTITIDNTTGKTYTVTKGTITGFAWGTVASNATFNTDYIFTLVLQDGYTIDGATVQAVIGGNTYDCSQTAASGTTYTFKLAGSSITGNVTINATAEEIRTSWDEGTHVIYEYGTTGAVDDNRAYYAENSHYKYYIEMGEYPQSKKADNVTITKIISGTEGTTGAIGTGSDGATYVYQVPVDTGTRFYPDGVNWFKVEPIRWIVLGGVTSTTDGSSAVAFNPANDVTYNSTNKTFTYSGTAYSKVLLIAEQALITTRYDYGDGSEYSSSNTDGYTSDQPWQDTDIYKFLNTSSAGLYNEQANGASLLATLFTDKQQESILGTKLYTGRISAGGNNGGSPTGTEGTSENNKLFLLADGNASGKDSDYTKENYKVGDYFTDKYARHGGKEVKNVTDYARACNTAYYANASYNTAGASNWWTRSGGFSNPYSTYYVGNGGSLSYLGVNGSNLGVSPSFILNLA